MPLENGLFAAAAGAILYALFGTSRQISTGPSSSLAAVAGGTVIATELAGDQAAELVAAITIVSGLLYLALRLLRLGWISRFLSKAVITGFLAGAAVDVVVGELSKLTGTDVDGENAWRELGAWVGSLGDVHGATLAVAAVALGVILALRFAAPAVPGALVLVVGGILAAHLFDLGEHGVALVGDVPRGLPAPELPEPRPDRAARRDDRRGGRRARAHRVLADRRRRPRVRRPAPLPRRRRPGVGRAGHGQHRRRRLPGHAGLDEPLRELAERVGRGEDADRVARHGRARAADADRAGARVLRPPEGHPGRGDHRRRRLRDDRRRRAAPAAPRHAVRLLDRRGRDRRRALGGRARGGRDRRRPLARSGWSTWRPPRRCRCSAASPGRRCSATSTEPGRRDVRGHRRAAARQRPVLRDLPGARGPHPRADRRRRRSTRSSSTSRARTTSTRRAPRSSTRSTSSSTARAWRCGSRA